MLRFKKRASADVPTPATDKVTLFIDDSGVVKTKDESGVVKTAGGGVAETMVDAKGDLLVASAADTVTRLAVGTDGQVLVADSGETTGVKWDDAPSGSYAPLQLTQNAQTGTTYTLVLTDEQKLVELSNAGAITLTVPPNADVAFPVGSQVHLLQSGAGQVTVAAGAGVTVNGTPGLKARAQWSAITLIKRATDTWVAIGDLAA